MFYIGSIMPLSLLEINRGNMQLYADLGLKIAYFYRFLLVNCRGKGNLNTLRALAAHLHSLVLAARASVQHVQVMTAKGWQSCLGYENLETD
jgi:hypothetical protein